MYQCCFCGRAIDKRPVDVVTLSFGVDEGGSQTIYSHIACLSESLHPSVPLAVNAPEGSASHLSPELTLVYGSDGQRNGVYVELHRRQGQEIVPLVEAFRSDRDGRITVWAECEELPFDDLLAFIRRARRDLVIPPEPLPGAV